MVRITPTEIAVGCDPFTGRPRSVRMGADLQRVVRIERVRDESAAYPVAVGPRTLFDIRTPAARLRLAFEHRSRRWLIEGLDTEPEMLAAVA
ncbi:MAG: hypothetical protein H0X60_04895 [Chloroflexi bacterium]|jgi:hypothetical protein|nr:hypothetical protein [Chloroflexota bacterium]